MACWAVQGWIPQERALNYLIVTWYGVKRWCFFFSNCMCYISPVLQHLACFSPVCVLGCFRVCFKNLSKSTCDFTISPTIDNTSKLSFTSEFISSPKKLLFSPKDAVFLWWQNKYIKAGCRSEWRLTNFVECFGVPPKLDKKPGYLGIVNWLECSRDKGCLKIWRHSNSSQLILPEPNWIQKF